MYIPNYLLCCKFSIFSTLKMHAFVETSDLHNADTMKNTVNWCDLGLKAIKKHSNDNRFQSKN